MKYILLLFTTLFIFIGCASRQYYEPENREFFAPNTIVQNDAYIKTYNPYGATLDSNTVVTKDGITKTILPKGYSFLNLSEDTIIATDNQENVMLIGEQNQTIELKKNVIAASKQGELLALIFADNSIAVYNTNTEQYNVRSYQQHSYINDTRIAAPRILKNIIIFPTLDGKILILDKKSYKTIRTINIDPNNQVNNIIMLETIGDTLIVATQNKITAIQNQNQITKEFFIQNYFVDGEYLYIAKLDGTISKYDRELNEVNSKKFKFAKVLSLSLDTNKNIYALELGGYLIKLSNDFTKTSVYRLALEDDEKMFAMNNKIYFDNKILYLDK